MEDIHVFPKQSDQINTCNEEKKVHGLAPVMSKICIKISQWNHTQGIDVKVIYIYISMYACMQEKWLQKATLSKRQPSSMVIVEDALSAIKLLECSANALKESAAAFLVAQSVLPRHSWMLSCNASKLWGAIAPTYMVIINLQNFNFLFLFFDQKNKLFLFVEFSISIPHLAT